MALSCLWSLKLEAQNLDSLLQNKRVYETRSIGNLPLPKIDGILDDSIWALGQWQGSLTQQQPVSGVPGSENTYVKVLYDRSNLYVAIICQDSKPDEIRDIYVELAPGAYLMLEIGPTQSEEVAMMAAIAGLAVRMIIPDLDQRARVVVAQS